MISIRSTQVAFNYTDGELLLLKEFGRYSSSPVTAFGLYVGETLVASLVAQGEKHQPGLLGIQAVWVEPKWRGHGFSKILLEHVLGLYEGFQVCATFQGVWAKWAYERISRHLGGINFEPLYAECA